MSLKDKEARVKLKYSEDRVNIYYAKDVQEAVNEFEQWTKEDFEPDKTLKRFKEIFGEWEK